jgi:MFS family permease
MHEDTDASEPATPRRGGRRAPLGANVVALSAVSFFTDLSSEMIYPLLPLFLTTTLGASAATLGLIEGAAESTAALLKLASGWWSDRVRRRKPLVLAGYALASVARPLVALAGSASQVLAIRLTDRVGKGIRSSPRDALIADSVDPSVRGRAFGFHRAADHAGAVAGPLLAFALLEWGGLSLRVVFGLAAIPAAVAMLVLALRVREPARHVGGAAAAVPPLAQVDGSEADESAGASGGEGAPPRAHDRAAPLSDRHHAAAPRTASAPAPPPPASALPRRFWGFLVAVVVFTLGNSTDAFLLLRASQLGVAAPLIPVLWAALHVVKSASSTPGGALSDRVGRKPLIVGGWLLYALVYVGFARAGATWHAWALFAVYGVFFGLTEGSEKALVTDLVPSGERGRAFGWYNLAVGVAALPASLIFGRLWDHGGPALAFTVGAAFALAAGLALALLVPSRDRALASP